MQKSSCSLTPEVCCLILVFSLYFLVFTSVKDVWAQLPITSLQKRVQNVQYSKIVFLVQYLLLFGVKFVFQKWDINDFAYN